VTRWQKTWPARAEHVGAARKAASAAAHAAGAAREVRDAVGIAVSEAVTNVILHGYRKPPPGEFVLKLEVEDDALRVTVRDDGVGMQPRTESPGAGLGLPLIANVTQSFSVSAVPDGGTEVCMTFPLQERARV
jgi:anti-sigma regulatory factor (Ser/Thr protein kinase)